MNNCHQGHIVRCLAISKTVTGTGSLNFGILFSGGEDKRVRVWWGGCTK
jgi:hypothetical protein